MGRGAAAHRATGNESCRRPARARGDASVDGGSAASPGAATVPRPVRGQRVAGAEIRARARLDGGPGGGRAHRRRIPPDPDRRATHALGLVLSTRHALLQLAARARAAGGARLRGRARALSPARPEPLATVLGARRATSPALASTARLAAGPRTRAPGLSPSGLTRRALLKGTRRLSHSAVLGRGESLRGEDIVMRSRRPHDDARFVRCSRPLRVSRRSLRRSPSRSAAASTLPCRWLSRPSSRRRSWHGSARAGRSSTSWRSGR